MIESAVVATGSGGRCRRFWWPRQRGALQRRVAPKSTHVECAQLLSRCVAGTVAAAQPGAGDSPHCKPIPLYCPTQRSVLARFLHRPSRNREARQPRRTVWGCVRAREGGAAPTPRRDCLCRTLSLGCLSSSGCNTPICVLFFLARFVIICGCWAAARRPSSARIVCDPQQALGGAAAPYYRCGGTVTGWACGPLTSGYFQWRFLPSPDRAAAGSGIPAQQSHSYIPLFAHALASEQLPASAEFPLWGQDGRH